MITDACIQTRIYTFSATDDCGNDATQTVTVSRKYDMEPAVIADIDDLRFHDLRHEATTRLFELGLNVIEVGAITGHKDLKMLNRYTHLKAETLGSKIRKLQE